jgi:hypothetical protein
MEASKILFVPLNQNFLNTNKVCGESLNIMQIIKYHANYFSEQSSVFQAKGTQLGYTAPRSKSSLQIL